jgi:hypothetical protein
MDGRGWDGQDRHMSMRMRTSAAPGSNVVVIDLDGAVHEPPADPDVVHHLLDPYLEGPDEHARLVLPDGQAELFSRDVRRGFLISGATGEQVWDLVVEAARAAHLLIFPPGHGTCVADEAMLDHLPPYLPEPVQVVRSGADLRHVIEADAVRPLVSAA